jgi:excisionase family DNA binding protein
MKRPKTPQTSRTAMLQATSGIDLIGPKDAMKLLGTTPPTFYRWLREGRLKGLKAGRQWRFRKGDLERFLRGEGPSSGESADLNRSAATLRQRLERLTGKPADLEGDAAQQLVMLLLRLGRALGASDIHLEPAAPEGRIRFRVDGVLQEYVTLSRQASESLAERWMTLCHCNVQRKGTAQDGQLRTTIDGGQLDVRVCFLPTVDGLAVTARLLDPTGVSLTLDRLPLQPDHREILLRKLARPCGLILVAGPSGSGKTTTLYACLHHLNRPGVKVITVEDPVEFRIPGAVQVHVREENGMTFESAARAILRSDPDVLLVSEIRSSGMANLSHQAALTGHLVLSAMHCTDAPAALRRLIDIGVPSFVISEALALVVAQRLVRRVCVHCSQPVELPSADLERARRLAVDGGLDWDRLPGQWRRAVGCAHCRQLGFSGRLAVNEMLSVEGAVQSALLSGADTAGLSHAARETGCASLAAEAVRRASHGETTLEEALRVTANM